jgi:hypothetical protein
MAASTCVRVIPARRGPIPVSVTIQVDGSPASATASPLAGGGVGIEVSAAGGGGSGALPSDRSSVAEQDASATRMKARQRRERM